MLQTCLTNVIKSARKAVIPLSIVAILFGSPHAYAQSPIVSNNTSGEWSSGGVWVGGVVPTTNDDVRITTVGPAHAITLSDGTTQSVQTLTIFGRTNGGVNNEVNVSNGTLNISGLTTVQGGQNNPSNSVGRLIIDGGLVNATGGLHLLGGTPGVNAGRHAAVSLISGTLNTSGNEIVIKGGNAATANGGYATFYLHGGNLIIDRTISLNHGTTQGTGVAGVAEFQFNGGQLSIAQGFNGGNGGDIFSGDGSVTHRGNANANVTIDVAVDTSATYNKLIAAATFSKTGLGALTFSESGTYTGNTTVSEGTLIIGNDFEVSGTTNIESGATYIVDDYTLTNNGTLTNSGTLITGFSSDGKSTIDATAGQLIFLNGSVWGIDTTNADVGDFFTIGEEIANLSWDATAAQAAIDRGNEQIFVSIFAGDNGINGTLFGIRNASANMSDVYLTSLLSHRYNTVYNATRWNSFVGDGRCATDCDSVCTANSSLKNAYVNYIGRSTEIQSSYGQFGGNAYDMTSNGVQFGFDLLANRYTQIGLVFGYEKHKNELRQDFVEANDYYFGLYGTRLLNCGYDLRGSFGYGHQSYDMERVSALGGNGRHAAGFGGDTFEVTGEIGKRYNANRCLSFRPFVGLDYFYNKIDGASENGISAVAYDSAKLSQMFIRVGSDVQYKIGRMGLNGLLSYSYDMLGADLETNVNQGILRTTLRGADIGNSYLTIGTGATYALGKSQRAILIANYYGDAYLDRDRSPWSHTAQAGLQFQF